MGPVGKSSIRIATSLKVGGWSVESRLLSFSAKSGI